MKNYSKVLFALLVLASFSLSSCKKDKEGTVKIVFTHVWGMTEAPFSIGTQLIHPGTQDSLTFTTFKYYVSNIKLKKEDGTYFEVPESYHLVNAESVAKSTISLVNVPEGKYTALEYILGVDSVRNVSGAQTGALSASEGMFWSWNSGYIMIKAEGMSPQSSTGSFAMHLGGFSGANNVVTPKTVEFGTETMMVDANTNTINLKANPARLWHGGIAGVGTTNTIMMPGATATTMATNFFSAVAYINKTVE